MTKIAFLRALNTGKRRAKNDQLAAVLTRLGLDNVITYQASGNLSFEGELDDPEAAIADALGEELGFDVPTFVRTLEELREIVESDVFAEASTVGITKTYVSFTERALDQEQRASLAELETEVDRFRDQGPNVFWLRDMEAGESMLNADLEKALGMVATRRGLPTLRRIVGRLDKA